MYVLDTNVVSAFMKGEEGVRSRVTRAVPSAIAVPQPVLSEIAYGIELLPTSRRRQILEQRFELFRTQFGRMQWSDEVSNAYARAKAALEKRGQRLEDFEIAIAAHALAVDAVLVTGNMKHMARIPGIRLENWSQ